MTRNEQILQMRAEGKSLSVIGKEAGVSRGRVSQIIKAANQPINQAGLNREPESKLTTPEPPNTPAVESGGKPLKEGGEHTQDINTRDSKALEGLIDAREKIIEGIIDNGRSLKKERLQSLVVSAGIVIDKIRLIQGDPTAIFRHQSIIADMSDEELRRIAGIDSPHKGREGTLEPLNVSSVGEDSNQAEKTPEMTSG